jgi:ketosteroid isomerase-like protein
MAEKTMEEKIALVNSLVNEYSQAYVTSDSSVLSKILHDDWLLIPSPPDEDGRREIKTKDQVIRELETGILKVTNIEDSSVKIRVFGQTVVVTGRRNSKATHNGRDISNHTWFTQVYVWQNGEFRCVSTHSSVVPTYP